MASVMIVIAWAVVVVVRSVVRGIVGLVIGAVIEAVVGAVVESIGRLVGAVWLTNPMAVLSTIATSSGNCSSDLRSLLVSVTC